MYTLVHSHVHSYTRTCISPSKPAVKLGNKEGREYFLPIIKLRKGTAIGICVCECVCVISACSLIYRAVGVAYGTHVRNRTGFDMRLGISCVLESSLIPFTSNYFLKIYIVCIKEMYVILGRLILV